jgi:hypothetical protein
MAVVVASSSRVNPGARAPARRVRRERSTRGNPRFDASLKRLDEIARADVALVISLFEEAGAEKKAGGNFSTKIDVDFFDE